MEAFDVMQPTDADGSGMCYVTGNGTDEDVDDGTTTLYSPIMEVSDGAVFNVLSLV